MAGARSSDTKQLSTVADALAIIAAFRQRTPAPGQLCKPAPAQTVTYRVNPVVDGPWLELDRCSVADGLTAMVTDPYAAVSLNQQFLPLCGPVAFWNVVAARHPVAVAQAGVTLYETGKAELGGLHLEPVPAVLYARLAPPAPGANSAAGPNDGKATQATWMLCGSVPKVAEGRVAWRGDPRDEGAGSWLPEDLAYLFTQTKFFGLVGNTCSFGAMSLQEAEQNLVFGPQGGRDYVLLIQAYLLVATGVMAAPPQNQPEWRPHQKYPNHWVILLEEVTDDGQFAHFGLWTWGTKYLGLQCSVADFAEYYHGSVAPLALV